MAGEKSQDFSRPKHDRMTGQKQEAEQGLEIGSREQRQQEQQGQLPKRKEGDHPGGSIGETSPNPSKSKPGQHTQSGKGSTRQSEQGQPQRQPRGEEEDASGQY